LAAAPSTTYRIELFASAACDPSGYGEGQTFIGPVTALTNTAGTYVMTQILPTEVSTSELITATATDPLGNTSQFSACQGIATRTCADDSDCDGYTDVQEIEIDKDPFTYCPIMRADIDEDGVITILDLSHVARFFGQSVPPAPARLNQDGDSTISILDLSKMASVFGQHVSACP
jgi:hypothetical protein